MQWNGKGRRNEKKDSQDRLEGEGRNCEERKRKIERKKERGMEKKGEKKQVQKKEKKIHIPCYLKGKL